MRAPKSCPVAATMHHLSIFFWQSHDMRIAAHNALGRHEVTADANLRNPSGDIQYCCPLLPHSALDSEMTAAADIGPRFVLGKADRQG